jgi:hypothetical protein
MLAEQIVKCLDTECLQRRVSVKGQLAEALEAGSVHPNQHATQIKLDRRWIDLSCPSRGRLSGVSLSLGTPRIVPQLGLRAYKGRPLQTWKDAAQSASGHCRRGRVLLDEILSL